MSESSVTHYHKVNSKMPNKWVRKGITNTYSVSLLVAIDNLTRG